MGSAFLSSCGLPAVSSAPSLQLLIKAPSTGVCMSLGSSADIIPFTRFLEYRQRRHQIAAANGNVVMPASTDVGSRPERAGTANADDGASPTGITRPRSDDAWRRGHVRDRRYRLGTSSREALSTVGRRSDEST